MKKKMYQQPEMMVVELEQMDIICTSGSNTERLTQDDFDWGDDSSGSSTESLTEDSFGW